MSLIEPLTLLVLIVAAAFLVDPLTHHWLTEVGLYALLSVKGAATSFFVYGGVMDLAHDLKARWKRWTNKRLR